MKEEIPVEHLYDKNTIACTPDDMGLTERGQLNLELAHNRELEQRLGATERVVEAGLELANALSSSVDVMWLRAHPRVERALRELWRLHDKVMG